MSCDTPHGFSLSLHIGGILSHLSDVLSLHSGDILSHLSDVLSLHSSNVLLLCCRMLSAITASQHIMATCVQGLLSSHQQEEVHLDVNEVRDSVRDVPHLPLVTLKEGPR